MIRIEVETYCQECPDFEPDTERSKQEVLYGTDPFGRSMELVRQTDTIIRCKYRNRCRNIERYLENKKENKHET